YHGRAPHKNVTLVQEEYLQEATAELGCDYRPGITRRNLTVRGIDLAALVGQRFRIGGALLEGTELCEPCSQMNREIAPGAKALLQGRCGIRATIIEGGEIRVGDPIEAAQLELPLAR
ncbi:MAG TPA: MOSC domain-containing protein, partial [bacterium]|nr:MOSC domain-containing protein [bacterium]